MFDSGSNEMSFEMLPRQHHNAVMLSNKMRAMAPFRDALWKLVSSSHDGGNLNCN